MRTTSKKINLTVIMLVVAMITSVFAVGTMSKYTIGGQAGDNAQVAKWGITIDIEGENSFATQSDDEAIVSSGTHKVVAPGTDWTEADGDGLMTVTLKGSPEVDFQLTIDLGETEDVFLAEGVEFPDYTKANGGTDSRETFTLDETYYPVVFTFTHYYQTENYSLYGCLGNLDIEYDDTIAPATGYTAAESFTGTLAELDALFANISAAMAHVDANYVLDDQFTLTWEWVFENNDQADTMLGNFAADKVDSTNRFTANYVAGEDYNLELVYDFTISIVQLDTDN